MRFWDTSAMVPLYTAEPSSPAMLALSRSDPDIQVWWATRTEIASALYRKVREGRLSTTDARQAASGVQGDCDALYAQVAPSGEIRLRAARLLDAHKLRAADALQLAAFLDTAWPKSSFAWTAT